MGVDLNYSAVGASFTHRFSHADWSTIDALRTHLPSEIAVVFDVLELGLAVEIETAALKESSLAIERFLGEHSQLLPATYQYKMERFPVPGVPAGGFDTGGFSGLQLPGDPHHFYSINAGLDKCVLEKMAIGSDGRGVIVEKRDLRGETELITENAGRILIRRRAAKSTLRRALREIATFAGGVASAKLMKIIG
jgi:hypothetical protein